MAGRDDRPTMLGSGDRQMITRALEEEDRDDRPELLGSTQDRRSRRAEEMARRGQKQLADLPDAMASGTVEVTGVTDTFKSTAITFPHLRFNKPPNVLVSADSEFARVWAITVTTTGFTLRVKRAEGTSSITVRCTWVATAPQSDD